MVAAPVNATGLFGYGNRLGLNASFGDGWPLLPMSIGTRSSFDEIKFDGEDTVGFGELEVPIARFTGPFCSGYFERGGDIEGVPLYL